MGGLARNAGHCASHYVQASRRHQLVQTRESAVISNLPCISANFGRTRRCPCLRPVRSAAIANHGISTCLVLLQLRHLLGFCSLPMIACSKFAKHRSSLAAADVARKRYTSLIACNAFKYGLTHVRWIARPAGACWLAVHGSGCTSPQMRLPSLKVSPACRRSHGQDVSRGAQDAAGRRS